MKTHFVSVPKGKENDESDVALSCAHYFLIRSVSFSVFSLGALYEMLVLVSLHFVTLKTDD